MKRGRTDLTSRQGGFLAAELTTHSSPKIVLVLVVVVVLESLSVAGEKRLPGEKTVNEESKRVYVLTSKDIEDENDDEDDWGRSGKSPKRQSSGVLRIHPST